MSYELLERRILRLERAANKARFSYRGASGSYANGTADLPVIHGTKLYDSHSAYNTTTGIFTCPAGQDGHYFFLAQWLLESGTYTDIELQIRLNNTMIDGGIIQNVSGFNGSLVFAAPVLVAGDQVRLIGFQTNAALATRFIQADSRFNRFLGFRL